VITLGWIALVCALVPALLDLWNSFLFREPPELASWEREQPEAPPVARAPGSPAVSVLIPARNEERSIAACVESVLASLHVDLEVIVLDDHSTDRTAESVRAIAARDKRVRLETAPALRGGWCGKQAACFALSRLARHDILTFLDADVRLEPDALARMILFQEKSGAALVSGFPRQETVTFLEKLLIPLIHWLLLSFLPIWAMRRFRWSAFGAGCGQWFLTTRAAYEQVGGHAAVKSSLHDGLTLPRAYRRAGFMTDICDATSLATCRMYRSSREVWMGLAKNAREGLAATGQIGFWTFVLFCGQVMPLALMVIGWNVPFVLALAFYTFFGSWLFRGFVRALFLRKSQQPILWVHLQPFAILSLLAIQWYAVALAVVGMPVGWKGRAHPQSPRRALPL
jgi:glycosyltransferase involved in cell wall biosynthesis